MTRLTEANTSMIADLSSRTTSCGLQRGGGFWLMAGDEKRRKMSPNLVETIEILEKEYLGMVEL